MLTKTITIEHKPTNPNCYNNSKASQPNIIMVNGYNMVITVIMIQVEGPHKLYDAQSDLSLGVRGVTQNVFTHYIYIYILRLGVRHTPHSKLIHKLLGNT